MKNYYLFPFSFITIIISINNVSSQMNMTEPQPDIRIKYEIINETLFCISKYNEGYSQNLISFARENRTIDENFNFDKIFEFSLSDYDKQLIQNCRRRAFYNFVFPKNRREGELVSCGLNVNTNENNNTNPNTCACQNKNYTQYSIFFSLKRKRRIESLK